jgi:hypothetical protein
MKGDCSFAEIDGIGDHNCSKFLSIKRKKIYRKIGFLYLLEFKSKIVKNKRSLKMNPAHK